MTIKISGIDEVNFILSTIAPREAINLVRTTTYDMAKVAAQKASELSPDNPATGKGDMKSSIKPQRGRGSREKVEAAVTVVNIRRNFFWRFLEYGQGPDNVEHAMFGKTLEWMRPQITNIYTTSFGKKLEARLARLRK